MELFEKHPISFEGENFEIRVLDGDQSVNVVFFIITTLQTVLSIS